MSWLQTTIGQVCVPTAQRDPSDNTQATFRYVDIAGIDRESKTISRAASIPCSAAPSRARKVIRRGDILVSTVRPNLNAVAQVPDELDDAIASTGFSVLRANPDVVSSRFLFYRVQHREFVNFLTANATGANYPAVSDGVVRRAPLPLPPLSEQRRIVEILDEADHLRKLRREADARAAKILPALFLKMFGDPAPNPRGSPLIPVRNLVQSIETQDPSREPDRVFDYIDIAGVDGVRGEIVAIKRLKGHEAPSRARQMVRTNDVLVSTVRPYLRATALVPPTLDGQIASTGFCVLRSKANWGHGYLYALSRLQWFTEQLNARARGASYPAVIDSDILGLHVPAPTSDAALCEFDRQLDDLIHINHGRSELAGRLEELFASLISRAFSGQLTANWRAAHIKELLADLEQQAKLLNLPQSKADRLAAEA